MSINISVALQIPTNVVEVGNEITAQQLGAITSGSSPTSANPFMTSSAVSTTYAAKASPTFTGTVTIPAGASISGYLTTASASSTYQTLTGMGSYATTSFVTSQGYIGEAPNDGSEYVRKNAAWAVATGGGGGGISDAPSDGSLYARQNAGWTSFTIPTVPPASVTNIDLTGNFNGYHMGSGNYTFKFDSTANTLRMQDGSGSGITISPTGITFPNSSVLSSSPAKSVITVTNPYTLASTSANNILYVPNDVYYTTITISVPEDSTYDFAVGTVIDLCFNVDSTSSIVISTTGAGSPTLFGNTGTISGGQNGRRTFIKLAANLWFIS